MDPFANDPYDNGSSDDGSFQWPDGQGVSEHADALLTGDLEESPLVQVVPPMPEAATQSLDIRMPSFSRKGPSTALAKRAGESNAQALASHEMSHPGYELAKAHGFITGPQDSKPAAVLESEIDKHEVHPGDQVFPEPASGQGRSSPTSTGTMQPPAVPRRYPGNRTADAVSSIADSGMTDAISGQKITESDSVGEPASKRPKVGPSSSRILPSPRSMPPLVSSTVEKAGLVINGEPSSKALVLPKKSAVLKKEPEKTVEKRPKNQLRKVLTGRKEESVASAFLGNKEDLLDWLPKSDCEFLGKQCWIFTVRQLGFVLRVEECQSGTEEQAMATQALIAKKLVAAKEKASFPQDKTSDPPKDGEESSTAGHAVFPPHVQEKLSLWTERMKAAMTSMRNFERTPLAERFPLDGPVSCLFPVATRNFLASVPIKSLFRFLALKKTETGAICVYCKVWRRLCGLPELSLLGLAKHLLGVASRVEIALDSIPPIDDKTRFWMKDPIIVLTGAAREFLVDCLNLYSAHVFVETRTKDLALALAAWREKKGLVPLKGSGKVAMISGWKANAKEAMECEAHEGRIVDGKNFEELVEGSLESPPAKDPSQTSVTPKSAPQSKKAKLKSKPKSKTATPKIPPSNSFGDRQAQYALHTKLFLDDVLGSEVTQVLGAANIDTAARLFELNFDPGEELCKCMVDSKMAVDSKGCESLLRLWCERLRDELDKHKRARDETESMPSPKRPRMRENSMSSVGSSISDRKPEVAPRASRFDRPPRDPYEALSAVTKRFLGSMGITTAEKFLTTRTTDIAQEFVQWRAREGMPELKGLGAIASVSGWKASIRKAAQDMGKKDVATLEPLNKSSWGPFSRGSLTRTRDEGDDPTKALMEIDKPEPVSHKDVLSGKSRCLIAVNDDLDVLKTKYRLEISVRQPNAGAPLAIFLTYKGLSLAGADESSSCNGHLVDSETPDEVVVSNSPEDGGTGTRVLPVLQDAPYGSSTLAKSSLDCDSSRPLAARDDGTGLIDVGKYGVHQIENQDLTILKEEIKEFVLTGNEMSSLSKLAEPSRYNVLLARKGLNKFRFLAYFDQPVEKGQTIQLSFPRASQQLCSGLYSDAAYQRRHLIDEALQLLSKEDLETMTDFLEYDVYEELGFQSITESMRDKDEPSVHFQKACTARRRLHWISWRLACAIGPDSAISSRFYFGAMTAEKDPLFSNLSAPVLADYRAALETEIRKELYAACEASSVCGRRARASWCRIADETFVSYVDCIIAYYSKAEKPNAPGLMAKLIACAKHLFAEELTVENCSFIASSQTAEGGSEVKTEQPSEERHVKCTCTDGSGSTAVPVETFLSSDKSINAEWYRQLQWSIVATVLDCAWSLLGRSERSVFILDSAASQLKQAILKTTGLSDIKSSRNSSVQPVLAPPGGIDNTTAPQPTAGPFFLGVVWPTLRKMGWRIEAGDSPKDVVFVAPDVKSVPSQRSNPWKQKRDQSRVRLSRQANRTGLGHISKLTKRLIIAMIPHPEGDEKEGHALETSVIKGVSAKAVLEKFVSSLEEHLEEKDKTDSSLARCLVHAIAECLETLAPMLLDEAAADEDLVDSTADVGCDILLRLLLVLPGVLRQAEIPLQELNDSLDIIQDLLSFMTAEYKIIFKKEFVPPVEHYKGQPKYIRHAILGARLKAFISSSGDGIEAEESKEAEAESPDVMTEILLEDDKPNLSDFLINVLEQAVPCRATEKDVSKKFRRIHVGYPGFVCRHCRGSNGEGRYFFTTIESLTTASTVFEKHVLKCPLVPTEIKSAVVSARSRHAEQRRTLPTGAQQAYFNRLWDRLRSAKIEGSSGGAFVLESYTKKSDPDSEDLALEFGDHMKVLDFVRTTAPWKNNSRVQEVVNRYYACLDYGGRIFYTSSMPQHFSAEWLLSKITPRRLHSRKRLLPG